MLTTSISSKGTSCSVTCTESGWKWSYGIKF